MYIDTHALVQSYLFCENKDVLNLYWRLHGQVFLARLACAPRQLFSGKKIKYVQLHKGCSHWGGKGDRRCKLFSRTESSGRLLQPRPARLRGPPDVLGALLGSALLCWCVLRSSSIMLHRRDRNEWEMAFNSAFTWHEVVFARRGIKLKVYSLLCKSYNLKNPENTSFYSLLQAGLLRGC